MRPERSLDRSLAWAWDGGVLGGLLPILELGFLYSALADRTVFVLWALVTGTCWVVLLRHGLSAGWHRFRLLGALALLLAAGLAVFAALEKRHHEILDLGFRAVFPGVYHPLATAPRTAWILAAVFGVVGIAGVGARGPRLPGPPGPITGPQGSEEDRGVLPSESSPPDPLPVTGEGEHSFSSPEGEEGERPRA